MLERVEQGSTGGKGWKQGLLVTNTVSSCEVMMLWGSMVVGMKKEEKINLRSISKEINDIRISDPVNWGKEGAAVKYQFGWDWEMMITHFMPAEEGRSMVYQSNWKKARVTGTLGATVIFCSYCIEHSLLPSHKFLLILQISAKTDLLRKDFTVHLN